MTQRLTPTISISRGDVVVVIFPTTDGRNAKARPAIVVQSDRFQSEFSQFVMIPITSHVRRLDIGCRIRIRSGSTEYRQMALLTDSLVMVDKPATIEAVLIRAAIGSCPPNIMSRIDSALRLVLDV